MKVGYLADRLNIQIGPWRFEHKFCERQDHERQDYFIIVDKHRRVVARWIRCLTRADIARIIRYLRASQPSLLAPDTLGWRAWLWDAEQRLLVSPYQSTPWTDYAMSAATWSEDGALRGVAGIHARRMPRDYRRARWRWSSYMDGWGLPPQMLVHGVVERYGRYVLGTAGWRAEHVVIRGLVAPSEEIAEQLRAIYPSVYVYTQEALCT